MNQWFVYVIWAVLGAMIGILIKDIGHIYRRQRQLKKNNIKKVWALFQNNKRVTNNEVERALGVSDATAERYLNQLEKEGKVKQLGRTGRYVCYIKK